MFGAEVRRRLLSHLLVEVGKVLVGIHDESAHGELLGNNLHAVFDTVTLIGGLVVFCDGDVRGFNERSFERDAKD